MDAHMKGAKHLMPASSLRLQLHHDQSLNVAVWACLTACFYAAGRVGKLTVPRLTSFDPSHHVTPSNLWMKINQNHLEATVLHVLHTKAPPIEGRSEEHRS